jgi:hypothetical protein
MTDKNAGPGCEPSWFAGSFHSRWEVSAFQPDGLSERWWVSFEPEGGVSAARVLREGGEARVRLRGTITPRGAYGHMGLYDREFKVDGIAALARADVDMEEDDETR